MSYADKTFISDDQRKELVSMFGHFLKRKRDEMDLSQKEMAEKLGYSLGRYRSFERGYDTNHPVVKGADAFHRWANALGISIDELLSDVFEGYGPQIKRGNLRRWAQEFMRTVSAENFDQNLRRRWSTSLAKLKDRELIELTFDSHRLLMKMNTKQVEHVNYILRQIVQGH